MEGQLAVPFHFAVEFLVLVVVAGAGIDALRKRRAGAGAWAFWQALGFVALGAAQAAHGALVVQADGDLVITGLRAGGFLILAVASRPAAEVIPRAVPAATMVAPALFVPGLDADWAFIPAIAAVAVAARGVRAHRTDQDPITFAFAGAFAAFAVAEILTVVAPPEGGTTLGLAHAARALAGLFLARWLWASFVASIRMRFVSAFVVVLALLVIVISASLNVVLGSTLEDEELKRLTDAGESRATAVQNLGQVAVGAAGQFAGNETVAVLLARRETDAVQALASQAFRLLPANADLIMFIDRRGRVLGSAEPTAQGQTAALPEGQAIRIAGSDVVAEAVDIGGNAASPQALTFPAGSDGEITSQIVVLGASPALQGRRVVGVVVVGYRIDGSFLEEVRQDTGAAATLLVGNRAVESTLGDAAAVSAALSSLETDLRRAREERATATASFSFERESYVTSFVPILTEDRQVAGVFALSRRSAVLADAQRDIVRTLFLITLGAVAIAALLAWLSGGRVTRPIRSLTAAARELQGGNLQARAKVGVRVDEVGTLGTAFNEMADELQRTTGALRRAAVDEATLRSRMEAILESMGDGLIATDADGTVVTCNRAAAEMIGRRADWTLGRSLGEVLDGTASNGRPLATVARSGRSAQGALRRARTGMLPVAISSAPLRDIDDEEVGRVVVIRDISVEQQAERMKSEFLSNVSHELRTPITPIKGYAEIMRRKKFPREKAEQFLEGILESTGRLERIVEILVDFAAIEAGRLQPRLEPISVPDVMDDLVARWRGRTKLRLVRRGGERLPPLLADPKLLDRSLDELVDNAIKFSPEGGQIEIIAEPSRNGTRRSHRIRLTIRDRGIGIEPGRVTDLFQDFRQLDGSETRSYGGLGLGLAYVKRIAGVHGGAIEVDSEPGKGSAFTLVLPAADTSGRARTRQVRATTKPTATRKTATRKTAARKTATRKTASRKTAARKTAARKTAARKTAARKTAARKTAKRAGGTRRR